MSGGLYGRGQRRYQAADQPLAHLGSTTLARGQQPGRQSPRRPGQEAVQKRALSPGHG